MNKKNISFIITAVIIIGCTNNKSNPEADSAIVSMDSFPNNSLQIQESKSEDDTLIKDGSSERLKIIRDNFRKLNSISNWTLIKEKSYEASIEGGTAKFYYENKNLQKIITVSFGETYRNLIEYYLLNGELSFVFEKTYRYNRPFNYDSISMKENNDTEVFDLSKASLIEVRNYFENGKLIHQISTEKEEAKGENLLSEGKIILKEYDKLIKIIHENQK